MGRTKTDEFVSRNSMLRKLDHFQLDQFLNITQVRNLIKEEPAADVVTREEMEQEFRERIREMLQDDEEDL